MIRWALLLLTFVGQQPERHVTKADIVGVYDSPQECEAMRARSWQNGDWLDARECREVDGSRSIIGQVDNRYGLLNLKNMHEEAARTALGTGE